MAACGSEAERLLDRKLWLLDNPASKLVTVSFTREEESSTFNATSTATSIDKFKFSLRQNFSQNFLVIRDELLHPTLGGNKLRKLDALVPFLQENNVTDVVTCGGCQSAHAAALAVSCAENGMQAHLLLRGEQLKVPTGYNLLSEMYGNVVYVPRSEYVNREEILNQHAQRIAGPTGTVFRLHDQRGNSSQTSLKTVAVVEEGAGNSLALPGLVRLVHWLTTCLSVKERLRIVVDSGTGTTAAGVALGVALLGLPWEVIGVMLADTRQGYEQHTRRIVEEFDESCGSATTLPLVWREPTRKRQFGKVLQGEVDACRKVARETGILVDPIYTLSAWEAAVELCQQSNDKVAILHTGGTLSLFGLAQRYPDHFHANSALSPLPIPDFSTV